MDEFRQRLKDDAAEIDADVSPELRARIDASLHAVARKPARPATQSAHWRFWWASSLTGIAAAIIVIAVMNGTREEGVITPESSAQNATVPPLARPQFPISAPALDVRSADFTEPLEEELMCLKADFEKARESVREDVDFTF